MPRSGPRVDSTTLRVNRVNVQQAEEELTLALGTAGIRVMLLRLRYDGWVDEVINSAGAVGKGPSAWTLIGRELSLEFGSQTAADVGFPRDCRLYLDVDDEVIRQVRTALLEILQCACFVVDTPEGRITS